MTNVALHWKDDFSHLIDLKPVAVTSNCFRIIHPVERARNLSKVSAAAKPGAPDVEPPC